MPLTEGAKRRWLVALDEADEFIAGRPPGEAGCLYWAPARDRFEVPRPGAPLEDQGLVPHYGRMGGVLPRPAAQRFEVAGRADAGSS